MLISKIYWHVIPVDGRFFDDSEQTIFSLVVLNAIVLLLIFIALKFISDRQRSERAARRATLRQARPRVEPGEAAQPEDPQIPIAPETGRVRRPKKK